MNAFARQWANGFRTKRVIGFPRGLPASDWMFGMNSERGNYLRMRRAWPNATKLECTAYGFARKCAMRPVKLPADRQPLPEIHPVFAGMFRRMGLAA